jgi:hypothetical protein
MVRRTVNIILSIAMCLAILVWLIGAGLGFSFEHIVVYAILLWVLRGV